MRLIGAFLVFCAFGGIGIAKTNAAKVRLCRFEALVRFLQTLCVRMRCERLPLKEFICDYVDPVLEECGFLPRLRSASMGEYALLWEGASETLCLSPEVAREVNAVGAFLGKSGLEAQVTALAASVARLEEALQTEKQKIDKNRQSTVALWGLSGVLIAILLL